MGRTEEVVVISEWDYSDTKKKGRSHKKGVKTTTTRKPAAVDRFRERWIGFAIGMVPGMFLGWVMGVISFAIYTME